MVEMPDGRVVLSYVASSAVDHDMTVVYVAASDSSAADKAAANYVCDGTDDEVTIKAAMTSLLPLGGKVYLYSGTYYFGSYLSWSTADGYIPFFELMGDEDANPVILPAANINIGIDLHVDAFQTIGITNITMNENLPYKFTLGAIYIGNQFYPPVEDDIDRMTNVFMDNVIIQKTGTGAGIYVHQVHDVYLNGVEVTDIDGSGISFTDITGDVVLRSCKANNNTPPIPGTESAGFTFKRVYGNIVCVSVECDSNYQGIYVDGCKDVTLRSFFCENNTVDGVFVKNASSLIAHTGFIRNNGSYGIRTVVPLNMIYSGSLIGNSSPLYNSPGTFAYVGGVTVTGYDPVFATGGINWISNCTKDGGAAWGTAIYGYTQSVVTDVDFVTPAQTKKTLTIIGTPPP